MIETLCDIAIQDEEGKGLYHPQLHLLISLGVEKMQGILLTDPKVCRRWFLLTACL